MNLLPRQVRDEHRESTQKQTRFCRDWYATYAHLAGIDDPTDHKAAAAGFYVTNIAHTLVLWRMQYVAARPIAARRASLSPAALERVLSFEERWCLRARESTLKDTMCVLWAIGTVGAAYVLRLTFTNMVWQSWFSRAAILEWVTTELVNTSVFMHAADHYRLCRMKERLTEKR